MAAAEEAAARQRAKAEHLSRARPVVYQSVDYVTPSTGHHYQIKPVSTHTDPVTKQTCSTYDTVSFSPDGKGSVTGTGHACIGANGKLTG